MRRKKKVNIFLIVVGSLIFSLLLALLYMLTSNDLRVITDSHQAISVNGSERQYRVKLPSGYSEDKQYPVVLAFHGYRDRGKQIEFYSGLSNLADREDFIAIYPEGVQRSWNGQVCCGYSYEQDIDDAQFIRELIDNVSSDYGIEQDSMYLTGFSNGGLMVQTLMQQYPDLFAAGAMVMSSSGVEGELLDIDNAKSPLLMVNGTNDRYIPFNPGDFAPSEFRFISAREAIDHWKSNYEATLAERRQYSDYEHYSYEQGKAPLEWHVYNDTPHRWPGWRVTRPWKEVPESTERIWEFLSSNS